MRFIAEHYIPATHPSLPGHFPGNPVVPGVVLLEEILTAVRKWQPESRIRGLQAVKFLHPVAPDSRFSIALEVLSPGKITFRCSAGQKLLNTGTIILHAPQGHE